MQRKHILLACFFVPAAMGSANCFSQQYPFVYYTPKDGLVNGRVKTIKQDSKGLLYFITYGGLSVYDGARFTNYKKQDGLADEVINDIVEWAPDTILVSSNAQKLNTLIHGKIGVYKTADNFYPTTNRFLKSSSGQWYITADEGLFRFANRKFTRLPVFFNGIDMGINFDHIVEWENYFLIVPWASEWNVGVLLYDRSKEKVIDTLSRGNGHGVTVDFKKRIWVNTPLGLQLLNPKSLKKGQLELSPLPKKFPILNTEELGIHFENDDNAWVFSKNLLRKISPDRQKEISFSEGIKGGLNTIFQDREGTIWMALDGAGVIKLKSTSLQLINSVLPGQRMSFSAIDQYGDTLWCYDRTGNCVYRVTKNGVKKFTLKQKLAAYNLNVCGNGIFLGDIWQLAFIKDKNDPASYHQLRPAWSNQKDLLGNSIIDPFGAVLQLLQRDDSIYYLSVIKNTRILFEQRLSYMADQLTIDHKGKLWLTTRNNYVQVYTIHPDQPSNYLQLEKEFHKGLPAMNPRSIAVDKEYNVWIGTRYNGLYQFNYNGSSLKLVKQYTTKEGLTDNFIYTLSCGINNTVWIGTQTGLDKIFLKNGRYIIANPGKSNNIFQSVFKIRAGKDGTVWAMNNDGSLVNILPETPAAIKDTPALLLTSIKVNDSLMEHTSRRFPYKQNNFSFSVAAPSFLDERAIRYSYLLEGSGNTHWSESSNTSTFNFINLTPGTYTLHVKADFPEEKYSSQTLSYTFTILPAWWQTWWFRTGFGLFVAAIGISVIRNYYKRKLEKQKSFLEQQQAIEKERTRIATDMHDDLGAGLSRIKFLSETIGIKKQREQPIEEEITRIREYSHEMIDKMGEIVWALNERNDTLSDLLTYTRAYAMEYLSQNGIRCSVDMPPDSGSHFLSGEFRRNIFLSVKEVLHNIIKHAQSSKVDIVIETGKELRIRIKDDGIGFNQNSIRQFSNGLYNIGKRMKDIKGRMELKSSDGTSVSLIAPLPH